MFFNQREFDICITPHALGCNQFIELFIGQRLDRIFCQVEILDGQGEGSVELFPAADLVCKVLVVVPDEVFLEPPFSGCRVIDSGFG